MKLIKMGLICSLFLFVSCGGSGGSGTSVQGGSSFKAQFIDAPVENMMFIKENGAVVYSDSTGNFECTEGELLTAKLGNLTLGKAACGERIFPHALTDNETFDGFNNGGTALSAILQMIDEDDDLSNGIKIPDSVHSVTTFPDTKFHRNEYDRFTEFDNIKDIINTVKPGAATWATSGDFYTYITSDVKPHLETSASFYLKPFKDEIINKSWTIAEDSLTSYWNNVQIINDPSSACNYDDAGVHLVCYSTHDYCQLTMGLDEGANTDTFKYMITSFPKMSFAQTFDLSGTPYRVMVELNFVEENGVKKVKGTFKDDHTVNADDVCSGSFEMTQQN